MSEEEDMPLIKLDVSNVSAEQSNNLLPALSQMLAETTGKPEKYVMATVGIMTPMMAGKSGPAAFADIRKIGGFTPALNKKISQALCALLKAKLQIPPDRVYMTFTDVPAANWGFNGGTFG
jgi:phenylpyruvate tautomerase PptA (4-oxalocrotonate tautomerase family)